MGARIVNDSGMEYPQIGGERMVNTVGKYLFDGRHRPHLAEVELRLLARAWIADTDRRLLMTLAPPELLPGKATGRVVADIQTVLALVACAPWSPQRPLLHGRGDSTMFTAAFLPIRK